MEVYILEFKHWLLVDLVHNPIITLFDLNQITGPVLYHIENRGFREYYHRTNDTKMVYLDINYKNGGKEYKYYFNYIISIKRNNNIDDILS